MNAYHELIERFKDEELEESTEVDTELVCRLAR